jgi:hypothetical protein
VTPTLRSLRIALATWIAGSIMFTIALQGQLSHVSSGPRMLLAAAIAFGLGVVLAWVDRRREEGAPTKTCPICAAEAKAAALVCSHCRYEFGPEDQPSEPGRPGIWTQ